MTRNVAILVFPTVEVLDFAGPLEVFSSVGRAIAFASVGNAPITDDPFTVYTVAEQAGNIRAANPLTFVPDYTIENCPAPDILVVPGGYGSREASKSERLLAWIKAQDQRTELTLSVCTGARILGAAGLLDGLSATTHYGSLDDLEVLHPTTKVIRNTRYVDNGRIITSAGVSAGIDMSFHVIEKLLGAEAARQTAQYIEYDYWQPGS